MYTFAIILLAWILYSMHTLANMNLIQSNVDKKYYRVRNEKDKVQAADTLARLNSKIETFLKNLTKKYPHQERVKRLMKRYKPRRLHERPEKSTYAAYSVDKGNDIFVCIREKNNGPLINDMNNLMYVMLHELAHVMTISVGHTDEFWENYKFLIEEAIAANAYTYEDYDKRYTEYCGLQLQNLNSARESS